MPITGKQVEDAFYAITHRYLPESTALAIAEELNEGVEEQQERAANETLRLLSAFA